ncbi:hypothetical protein BHM03_00047342, partial [Ensete ventricosum]
MDIVSKVCNFGTGRYIPVRQVAGTQTARYLAVPPKIDRWRSIEGEIGSIEGEKGKKKKRKRKKRREEENLAPVLTGAPSSPSPAVCQRAIAH